MSYVIRKCTYRAYADSKGPDSFVRPQSNQGISCPLIESFDTKIYRYIAAKVFIRQSDLSLYC